MIKMATADTKVEAKLHKIENFASNPMVFAFGGKRIRIPGAVRRGNNITPGVNAAVTADDLKTLRKIDTFNESVDRNILKAD